MSTSVFAANNNDEFKQDFKLERSYARAFLKSIGHTSNLGDAYILKNLILEDEAVCFLIVGGGYIILNLNDLSIPELSFEGKTPYNFTTENKQFIYYGPLQYFEIDTEGLRDVYSGKTVKSNNITKIYSKGKVDYSDKLENINNNNPMHINIEKYLSSSLRTWYVSGGFCGPIAGSICMMYYDDNIDSSYVITGNQTVSKLVPIMNNYMDTNNNGATSFSEVRNGLNNYMNDVGVTNTAGSSTFSFSKIRNNINDNRPVIVGTLEHPTYGDHWVTAHGFFESIIDGNYIIVNNGWGNNNVWITPDTTYLDYVIYFNN